MADLKDVILAAFARRSKLLDTKNLDAIRLFHGAADGIDGLVVERFGPVLIVQVHEERLRLDRDTLHAALEEFRAEVGATAVYRKHFVRDRARAGGEENEEHRRAQPWIGEPAAEEIAVTELGRKYFIRPYDGFSVGLFLEHRDNRERVNRLAAGRRVLNLFAYTCGFSVAATAGGAANAASVDSSARYLEWGKRNFAANNVELAPHLFFCSDVLDFFKRASRQGRRYDFIILDPPTFSRSRRPARVFVLQEQIEPLLAGAISLLERDGILFFATNDRALSLRRIENHLGRTAGERRFRITERPVLPPDFPDDPDYSKSLFAQFA